MLAGGPPARRGVANLPLASCSGLRSPSLRSLRPQRRRAMSLVCALEIWPAGLAGWLAPQPASRGAVMAGSRRQDYHWPPYESVKNSEAPGRPRPRPRPRKPLLCSGCCGMGALPQLLSGVRRLKSP